MLGRLTKRAEFLAARKGARAARPLVSIEALVRPLPHSGGGEPLIRIGFTATKRIGNAVTRNRAKRRLREAARQLLPAEGQAGCDYVLIARDQTASAPWGALLDDLRSALIRLRPALAAAQQAALTANPSPQILQPRARRKDE